jgi:hypothetical protein
MTMTLSKLLVATTALIAVAAPVKAEIDVRDVGARLLEETDAKALLRDSGW